MRIESIFYVCCLFFKCIIGQEDAVEYYTSYLGTFYNSNSFRDEGSRDDDTVLLPNGSFFDELTDTVYFIGELSYKISKFSAITGTVSKFAGSGLKGHLDGNFATAQFRRCYGLARDRDGNIYVSDWESNTIRKLIVSNSTVTTFAGIPGNAGALDGPSGIATLYGPLALTFDSDDYLYFTNTGDNKIRRISPDGQVVTIAGNGGQGYVDGPALDAVFNRPIGIAIDHSTRAIYVSDQNNHVIRKIANGIVSTFAGSYQGYADGFTTRARFSQPEGIAIDGSGNLFVSDSGNLVVRKIDTSGYVSTIVGRPGIFGTESGPGLKSSLMWVRGVHASASGTVFLSDFNSRRIRIAFPASELNPNGKYFWQKDDFNCYTGYCVQTLTGSGVASAPGKSGHPTVMALYRPVGIFHDEQTGNIYITSNYGNGVFVRNANGTFVYRLAGKNDSYTDGHLFDSGFEHPIGITMGRNQTFFISDYFGHTIRKIDMKTGLVSTFAGSPKSAGSTDGQGTSARFYCPRLIKMDIDGNIYVADQGNHKIRKINSSGFVETLAGNGNPGMSDTSYLSSQFNEPHDVAIDVTGKIFVSDSGNHRIRKLFEGSVSTWAGSIAGFSDGQGTTAKFLFPWGIAIDKFGNLFVSDSGNRILRMINNTAYVTTIAGKGYGNQNGPGPKAEFYSPLGLSVKSDGSTIYVADYHGNRIRVICYSKCQNNGTMDCITGLCNCPLGWDGENCTTIAKSKTTSNSKITESTDWTVSHVGSAYGDFNGPRTVAQFKGPSGIEYNEKTKTIFVSDCKGNYIKKITENGDVSSYAGTGVAGIMDGLLAVAQFNCPMGLAFDSVGDLYICDYYSHTIRKISNGTVSTFAGSARVPGSIDGLGSNARFTNPLDIISDKNGFLLLIDNHKIRQINPFNAQVTTIMGKEYAGHVDGPASEALAYYPGSLSVDSSNSIFFTDASNHVIRKISSDRATVSTIAGSDNGDSLGIGTTTMFSYPFGIAIDQNDILYVADNNKKIKRIDQDGIVTLIAGSGGYGSRSGKALESTFRFVRSIKLTPNGTLIIADEESFKVRLLFPTKMKGLAPFNFDDDWDCKLGSWCVQRFAGNEVKAVNNGPNLIASFDGPQGLAIDEKNNRIFLSKSNSGFLRLIKNGLVQTFAGSGTRGWADGRYFSASFTGLMNLALDPTSTILYASDSHCIRKIFINNGTVTTLAGNPNIPGSIDGQGLSARFNYPWGLAIDKYGGIYVAGSLEHKIRFVTASGLVSTLAGFGEAGYQDGSLTDARFNFPRGIAVDSDLIVFVCDTDNHLIRKIDGGIVSTVAGNVNEYGWRDGNGKDALFNSPYGIAIDTNGNLVVTEAMQREIRLIDKFQNVTTIAGTGASGTQTGPGQKAEFQYLRGNPAVNSNGTIFIPDWGGHVINTICMSTCVNGVMVDCVSLTCKCDIGWTGSNCNTSIVTTSSSTKTSTATTSATFATTTTTSSSKKTDTETTTSMIFLEFTTTSASGNESFEFSIIAVTVGVVLLLISAVAVACIYYRRRMGKSRLKINYNSVTLSMDRLNLPSPGPYPYIQNGSHNIYFNANSTLDSNSATQTLTSGNVSFSIPGYKRIVLDMDFYLPEGAAKIDSGGNASLFLGKLLNQDLIATNAGNIDVAVKMFKVADNISVNVFHYEIGVMANLQENPNIAKLIGFTVSPYYCYVMKMYRCSLESLINDISFGKSLETCAFIGYEISNGMSFIHSKGVIHLDLKPRNILIEDYEHGSYKCVICDFGSSSIIGDTPRVRGFETPQRLEFTCRYTPPEVALRIMKNERARPSFEHDKSIDVYAFAITMFEVITRKKSYQGMNANEIINSVIAGHRPVWPTDVRMDASYASLLELVQNSWAASPTSRPKFDDIHYIFMKFLQS